MSRNFDGIKQTLLAEKESILREVSNLDKDAAGIAESQRRGEARLEGSQEGDTLSVERGVLRTLSSTMQQQVTEVDRALARIEAGTYGLCDGCGNEIPVERLVARPKSTQCVACASLMRMREIPQGCSSPRIVRWSKEWGQVGSEERVEGPATEGRRALMICEGQLRSRRGQAP